jgi:thioredoxin reductase (NADPH)
MITYDVIIIGAGPAGLTAAIYVLRAGLHMRVIEDPSIASQAGYAAMVENFPGFPEGISGVELLSRFKKQVSVLGGNIIPGGVKAVSRYKGHGQREWQVLSGKESYKTVSLIVASGAQAKRLNVKGESEFSGKGVSYCAVCDGVFFKDKHIAVIGGGDSALEEALFLTRFAKKVTIIHRRDKLRAVKLLQNRAFADKKIEIAWNSVIDEVLGKGKVERIRIKNTKSGSLTETGCEGVFVSIGKTPNTDFLKNVLDIDENGYIITDNGLKASAQGIFACGDCRNTMFRQIVTACGDGALAADSCIRYIDGPDFI